MTESQIQLFDPVRSNDEYTYLTTEGLQLVSQWVVTLVDNNYDLRKPTDLWNASAFLVSRGSSDFGVEATTVALAIAVDFSTWDQVKSALKAYDEDG